MMACVKDYAVIQPCKSQVALTIHPNNNHGTETQQSTSDFDANGNLLTLNNIGTLHWHYNNTLNQMLVAKCCCLLGVRGWLGYCLCHRRKFADKILG
jgi:hypothetical protein